MSENQFSIAYYSKILELAKDQGYKAVTLNEFVRLGCPKIGHLIIRHDLDKSPITLKPVLDAERKVDIKSTTFVRVAGSEYNFLSYPCFKILKDAEADGFEIGLHSNFVEFSTIMNLDPILVLQNEVSILKSFFNVSGIATHRDINYMYNSLPVLESQFNWHILKDQLKLNYQAYSQDIMNSTQYVNEGLNPHLCWRSKAPEHYFSEKKSIYLLTHSHWWYVEHAFENYT